VPVIDHNTRIPTYNSCRSHHVFLISACFRYNARLIPDFRRFRPLSIGSGASCANATDSLAWSRSRRSRCQSANPCLFGLSEEVSIMRQLPPLSKMAERNLLRKSAIKTSEPGISPGSFASTR
jgi:hypothetical protein